METLAADAGKLLLTQGLLGLACLVMGIVIVLLARAYDRCQSARIEKGDAIAVALATASSTMATVAAALESRSGHFERLGQRVDEGNAEAAASRLLIIAKLGEVDRSLDELRRSHGRPQ
jgi:hypothetical protein